MESPALARLSQFHEFAGCWLSYATPLMTHPQPSAAFRPVIGILDLPGASEFRVLMGHKKQSERAKAAYNSGLYQDALQILENMFLQLEGRSAAKTELVDVLLEMGRCLRRLARYADAEDELKRALALMPGKDEVLSLERAKAVEELGLVYIEQARYQDAENALAKVLAARTSALPEDHEEIGDALNNLGLLAWSRGDDKKAEVLYNKALSIRAATVGKDHYKYAETLDNLGALYQRTDKLNESKKAHEKALSIKEKALGVTHPDVGYSLVNLAAVNQYLGKNDHVESLLRRAIDVWTLSLGAEHHHTSVAINNLGGYYLEEGRVEEATHLFEQALTSLETVLGKDNPALITYVHNLATVCRRQHRSEEAQAYEDRLQTLMLRKLSMEGGHGTQNLLLHARSLQTIKDYDQAAQCLVRALDLAESEFGANSLRAAYILDFLGSNSLKQKDIDKAREYFNRSLNIKTTSLGAHHSDVEATQQNLRFLSALQSDWHAASLLLARDSHSHKVETAVSGQKEPVHLKALNLSQYQHVVVLTGAGISVASGLKTYRGTGGIWEVGDTARLSRVEILDEDPDAVWPFFGELKRNAKSAQPNAAHEALVQWESRLEDSGAFTLITQNVDGLHQRAGCRRVLELHGSLFRTRCSNNSCPLEPFEDEEFHLDKKPICQICGSMLRPDIVFFGEPIPPLVERAVRQSFLKCDLFFAAGTSGTVAPACSFVIRARDVGAHTILVNLEEMDHGDHLYHHEILGRAEEILPALIGSSY